jgi:hypothetical protein
VEGQQLTQGRWPSRVFGSDTSVVYNEGEAFVSYLHDTGQADI